MCVFVLVTTLEVEMFKLKCYRWQTVLHSAPESERITPQSSGAVFVATVCCHKCTPAVCPPINKRRWYTFLTQL